MGAVTEAMRHNFRELVSEGTVLVDVWGPRCGPCLALMPHVEEIAAERDDLRGVKLEAPKVRRLCIELGLMDLPAFLLVREGEEVDRLADPNLGADQLRSWLGSQLDGGAPTDAN